MPGGNPASHLVGPRSGGPPRFASVPIHPGSIALPRAGSHNQTPVGRARAPAPIHRADLVHLPRIAGTRRLPSPESAPLLPSPVTVPTHIPEYSPAFDIGVLPQPPPPPPQPTSR